MSVINQTTLFSINPDMSYTQIDDEAVLMGLMDDSLYGLNHVGAEILKQLELGPKSVYTISKYLLAHFDIDEMQCLEDTLHFFESLLKKQFIIQETANIG